MSLRNDEAVIVANLTWSQVHKKKRSKRKKGSKRSKKNQFVILATLFSATTTHREETRGYVSLWNGKKACGIAGNKRVVGWEREKESLSKDWNLIFLLNVKKKWKKEGKKEINMEIKNE